ncbi:CocE/NonD family hydrolase, partial [Nocardioides sp.]|uniref:CocE/NonD family hydrolase n=1 Tax=Nocardioides sp. TaxID=35761 RepID=UPI00351920A2
RRPSATRPRRCCPKPSKTSSRRRRRNYAAATATSDPNPHRRRRALIGGGLAAALAAGALAGPAGSPATARPAPESAQTATAGSPGARATTSSRPRWTPRPELYDGTETITDLPIPMDDGVVLRADLTRPTLDGESIDTRLPVIITITAYNKTVLASSPLGGGSADYLVKRGYQQLTVDARGTGTSGGVWGAFSAREAKDAVAIVNWAATQPWSDGNSGMSGPSYMGISQLFAAAGRPRGLKAIFPQVPGADVYRDVVASGGQIDVGFIPLWLGLVTGAGLIPPAYGAAEPAAGFSALTDRLTTATTFTAPLIASALLGGEPAYDGAFYRERSVMRVIDRVRVPTFLISGEYDLFQRGTPLLFERLRRNRVPVRMITGPWDHLEGSSGAGLADAGYGTLQELQLRWFDHYVKGRPDATLFKQIAPFSYYEQGTDRWVRTQRYVDRDLRARSFRLSGDAAAGGRHGRLTLGDARAGEAIVPAVPVTGLCTRSANQWTAGVMNQVFPRNPCFSDNRLNDLGGVTYETAPMERTLRVQGPINARLYISTPSGDGMLSVTVSDVAPNGTVSRLTGGWQVVSHRALDRNRSRYLDGTLVQPFHPFTKAAQRPLARGTVAPVDVEVFPTGAAIRPGHRLRVSIQAFDVPHLLSPLPSLPAQLLPLTVHSSARYPSVLSLPVRR